MALDSAFLKIWWNFAPCEYSAFHFHLKYEVKHTRTDFCLAILKVSHLILLRVVDLNFIQNNGVSLMGIFYELHFTPLYDSDTSTTRIVSNN